MSERKKKNESNDVMTHDLHADPEAFQHQNDELLQGILERTFYKGWTYPDKYPNHSSLEVVINPFCNLGCKYCYLHRHGEQLYPREKWEGKEEVILANAGVYFDFIRENGYRPKIEVFSGEPLVQDVTYKLLDMMFDKLGNYLCQPVIIPTNYTFIASDALTERVENVILKSREVGMPVALSASVEGKYMEQNRPYRAHITSEEQLPGRQFVYEADPALETRDDEYYDKVFEFAAKWKFGFHPMIYSEGIEDWKKNFDWYQSMLKKYDMPWHNIYLLEVRNPEWTGPQIKEFCSFVDHVIKFSWDMCEHNVDRFLHFLFKQRGFNILTSPWTTIGRGIGCSMQSSIYLYLGDLSFYPCHRQSYEFMKAGTYVVEDGQITGVKAQNVEMYVAELSLHAPNFPYCESCPMNTLCSFGCLGSQYETMGDPFTPIPQVCALQWEKVKQMVKTYQELGIWSALECRLTEEKRNSVYRIMEVR